VPRCGAAGDAVLWRSTLSDPYRWSIIRRTRDGRTIHFVARIVTPDREVGSMRAQIEDWRRVNKVVRAGGRD